MTLADCIVEMERQIAENAKMPHRQSFDDQLTQLWAEEFVVNRDEHGIGVCGLCNGSGTIHDSRKKPVFTCICPAGRALKKMDDAMRRTKDVRPKYRRDSQVAPEMSEGESSEPHTTEQTPTTDMGQADALQFDKELAVPPQEKLSTIERALVSMKKQK